MSLQDFCDQTRAALGHNLYFVALSSALSLPDSCGALDDAGGVASGKNYAAWFDKWVAQKYMVGPSGSRKQSLTGMDCYKFRCSLLHQASAQPHSPSQHHQIIFLEPQAWKGVVMHNNMISQGGTSYLNLDIPHFCDDIIVGVDAWYAAVKATPLFVANYAKVIRRHPNGFGPIQGGPVIA
jgi:hypothetical protein